MEHGGGERTRKCVIWTMMGDDENDADVADSHRFLTGLRVRHPALLSTSSAGLDAGAGVGRVTKNLLLRHCRTVHLVEASEAWNKQSRRYLGKKRSLSCTFARCRLEDYVPKPQSFDLIWVQVRNSERKQECSVTAESAVRAVTTKTHTFWPPTLSAPRVQRGRFLSVGVSVHDGR